MYSGFTYLSHGQGPCVNIVSAIAQWSEIIWSKPRSDIFLKAVLTVHLVGSFNHELTMMSPHFVTDHTISFALTRCPFGLTLPNRCFFGGRGRMNYSIKLFLNWRFWTVVCLWRRFIYAYITQFSNPRELLTYVPDGAPIGRVAQGCVVRSLTTNP